MDYKNTEIEGTKKFRTTQYTPQDLKERILKTELDFPKYISNSQATPYGMLYWDEADKENHNLNHAIIYPNLIKDLKPVLEEIAQFYLARGIQPRIHQPYTTGYFLEHANDFRISGYDVKIYPPTQFMLLSEENRIHSGAKLSIRELTEWDPRIAADILIPDGNEKELEQIKRNIYTNRYRVLVGYLEDQAVSLATIFYGDYGIARLDSAETAEELRGRGYASELVSAIVEMHRRESSMPLYLWPQNVTAGKIFHQAGFRLLFQEERATALYHRMTEEENEWIRSV